MVSTAVGFVGGKAGPHLLAGSPRSVQLSLMTTTNGPGVSGIFVLSRTVPLPCSFTSIVPSPPWKMLIQSLNCEKR